MDRSDRLAMAAALAAHDIDLVAVLSPWPETFSFVTHEALAAGADVVALADAGGVVDAVTAQARGVVLRTEADVLHFFLDGPAEAYVRAQRAAGRARARLIACGTTATVDPAREDGPEPERLATEDPDLIVVARGAVLRPSAEEGRLVFALPEAAGEVRIVSRHVTPHGLRRRAATIGGWGWRWRGCGWTARRPGRAMRGGGAAGMGRRPGRRCSGPAAMRCWRWGGARRLELALGPGPTFRRCPLGAAG